MKERTQGKGEPIAEFASKCQYIAGNLQALLAADKLVRMASRNLHPDYQTYMFKERVTTFRQLIQLGQEFEQEREYVTKYSPPKAKNKVRLPG